VKALLFAMHYNSKHKKKVQLCQSFEKNTVAVLKRRLESQQRVFRKQSTETWSSLGASYRVAHLLAEESKSVSD
jgi:hypothetical protein